MPANAALAEAVARHKRGDVTGAIAAYQAILAETPEDAGALHFLGFARFQTGDLASAAELVRRACALAPDEALYAANLAKILKAAGDLQGALEAAERACALEPSNFESRANAGSLAHALGDFEGAAVHLESAARLKPHPGVLGLLSDSLKELGERGRAAAVIEGAGPLREHPSLLTRRAALASEDGDFETAEAALRKAVAAAPEDARALAALLTLRSVTPADAELDRARSLLAAPRLPDPEKARLGFGLARALERLERYEDAFDACAAANALVAREAPFSAEALEAEVAAVERVFTRELISRLAKAAPKDRAPIYIVGLPRTGTTLVEQILASHPSVFGADERQDIPRLAARIAADHGGYPDGLESLQPDDIARLATEHLEQLHAVAPEAARIVDKLPFNFAHAGLIAALMPGVTIIHCERDLRDVFVSNFFTEFSAGLQGFRTSPENFAAYARLYSRLMAHWGRVMPGRIVRVRYERLIEDLEGETRRLLDAAGLEFDPACLAFHKTERTVRTPSRWQVRQPVYKTAAGRWRCYEARLGPVLDLETG
ncbi:MAG: tetratricopeptide repeat-containing sulfotransferase family protein [Oceanicaulis sp.]